MLTCRPGQMRAYLRAEFLIKVEFLTRPGAAAALPSSLAAGRPGLRLFAPPPRPTVAAPARHRRAGSWGRRAATALPHPCAAARPPCRRWRQGPRKQPRPCGEILKRYNNYVFNRTELGYFCFHPARTPGGKKIMLAIRQIKKKER